MKHMPTRYILIVLLTLTVVGLGEVLARETESDTQPKLPNRWHPTEEDRSAYRDIIDFNIFRSDRKRLADQADRDRNPPTRDTETRDPVKTVEKPPPNPDSFLRLTGIGHTSQGVVAFIEHMESGELSRLTGPEAFSLGEVTDIGYRSVMYIVDGERRKINIGETFVGERVVPAGASSVGAGGASSSGKSDLSPAERLRLLREKRAREIGTDPPAETPAPIKEPDSPDASEKTSPTEPATEAAATSILSTPNATIFIPTGSEADANNP